MTFHFGEYHLAALFGVSAALACGLAVWYMRRGLPARARSEAPVFRTRQWLKSGLALVVMGGMGVILARTDVVMLGMLAGPEAAGIYNAAARLVELVSFGSMVIGLAMAPVISTQIANADMEALQRTVTKAARFMTLFALPITLIYFFYGPVVLGLFGPEFGSGNPALNVLTLSRLVAAFTGPVGLILVMAGMERLTAIGLTIVCLANIALNAVLIPPFGLIGAAIATSSTQVVWAVVMAIVVWRRIGLVTTAVSIESNLKRKKNEYEQKAN